MILTRLYRLPCMDCFHQVEASPSVVSIVHGLVVTSVWVLPQTFLLATSVGPFAGTEDLQAVSPPSLT